MSRGRDAVITRGATVLLAASWTLAVGSFVLLAVPWWLAGTIDSFSRTVRSEADLPDVSELLVSVTARTTQPAHRGLWLREAGRDS